MHVSYWDKGKDILIYGHRDVTTETWTWEPVAPSLGSHGYKSALAVDDNGFVHIVFLDRNINNEAEMVYAYNSAGVWLRESPIGGEILGPYGYDFSAPRLYQGSLDIEIKPDGLPFIAYYDGSVENYASCSLFPFTPFYLQYDLELGIAEKTNLGWITHAMPDIPDESASSCLPNGDRFGEFCQIIPRANNKYYILTNSMHNHKLLLFKADFGNVSQWTYQDLDSVSRVLPGATRFYETFEYPRAYLEEDSILHFATAGSPLYGQYNLSNRNPLTYQRFSPDASDSSKLSSEYYHKFSPDSYYRTFISIEHKGRDTTYLVYYNVSANQLEVQYTFNRAGFWRKDTIMKLSTNHRLESKMIHDKLLIWVYDALKDAILEISMTPGLIPLAKEYITKTEERGRLFSSRVKRQPNGSDHIFMTYSEDFSEEIRYAQRTNGTWSYEPVTTAPNLASLALTFSPNDEPEILYSAGNPEQVSFAIKQGANWVVTSIMPIGLRNLFIHQSADSVYGAGYDLLNGQLYWMSKAQSGGSWQYSILDASDGPTGQNPVIREKDGALYLGYVALGTNQVKLATRLPGQAWTFEEVTPPFNYSPQNLDFQIYLADEPVIAFKDGNTDKIILVEKKDAVWTSSSILGDPGNLIGSPLHLILDSKDRPWILYNFPDIQNELRLIRRDAQGNWVGVSVLNNQGEVANSFNFHLVGDDFYILGKKTIKGSEGLAMLFAEEGVRTLIPDEIPQLSLTLVPNPASQQAEVVFTIPTSAEADFWIYNLHGQILHVEHKQLAAGEQRIELPISTLAPGSYVVKINVNQKTGRAILIVSP